MKIRATLTSQSLLCDWATRPVRKSACLTHIAPQHHSVTLNLILRIVQVLSRFSFGFAASPDGCGWAFVLESQICQRRVFVAIRFCALTPECDVDA